MASDSEDSDLSFHINSTYCSSSDSDEDCSKPVPRKNNARINSANPRCSQFLGEQENADFVDNPSNFSPENKTSNGLKIERAAPAARSTSQADERSILGISQQIPAHVPSHSVISPLVPRFSVSPGSNDYAYSTHTPLPSTKSSGSVTQEIGQLKAAMTSLTERNAALQAENQRLLQQAHKSTCI